LLGVFGQYDEVDAYRSTRNRRWQAEWFTQDTWRASSKLTLDYGIRFLFYTPYSQANMRTAAFVPDRYDAKKAPRLYYPAVIGGKSEAFDPGSTQAVAKGNTATLTPATGVPSNSTATVAAPTHTLAAPTCAD